MPIRFPSLTVYPNVLDSNAAIPGIVKELTRIPSVQQTWTRSIAWNGGYYMGKFRLSGIPRQQLRKFYNTWLGYHLQELTSGITWEGMIYDMVLVDKISRRRTLDTLYNSIYAAYKELIQNGGFENTGGSPFDDWTYVTSGTDVIASHTTLYATGAKSARFTYGSSGTAHIHQTASNILPNTIYRLRFQHYSSTGTSARFTVRDVSNSNDIIGFVSTGLTNARWETFEVEFAAPTACYQIQIRLYCPPSSTVYIDDVSMVRLERGQEFPTLTAKSENADSIARYGTKAFILQKDFETISEAEAGRDKLIQMNPWPTVLRDPRMSREPYLDITVCGYIFTLKWLYFLALSYGSASTNTALMTSILNIAEYVQTALVTADSIRFRFTPKLMTLREAANILLAIGDNSGTIINPFRLHMTKRRTAVFETIKNEPTLVISNGQLANPKSPDQPISNPYAVQPGITRDLDDPTIGSKLSHFYASPKDFLIDKIIVGPNGIQWSEGVNL